MRLVELTQGKFAKVDDEDYEWIIKRSWSLLKNGYARAGTHKYVDGKRTAIHMYMHREIMKAPAGKQVDHINGDRLDNRKENLRIVESKQNNYNAGISKNNKAGYKGVAWDKAHKRWGAWIKINYKSKFLGYHATPLEAAKAYNQAASEEWGEYARVNKL